ncbi:MAG: hypothetical protein WBB28_23125, partial [Crinalium sp.]
SAVIHALGGKDAKVEVADFLPFPNAVAGESKISAAGALVISKSTAQVFFKLLAEGKLPKEFAGQLGPQVVRWKQLAEG